MKKCHFEIRTLTTSVKLLYRDYSSHYVACQFEFHETDVCPKEQSSSTRERSFYA